MPVHHVNVHPISTACLNSADFVAEPGKVGSEDGGGDDERALFHGKSYSRDHTQKETPARRPGFHSLVG
jgi:hypothetical protein